MIWNPWGFSSNQEILGCLWLPGSLLFMLSTFSLIQAISLCPNCSWYIQWHILALVFLLYFWLSKKQSSKISSFFPASLYSRAHIMGMEMICFFFVCLFWLLIIEIFRLHKSGENSMINSHVPIAQLQHPTNGTNLSPLIFFLWLSLLPQYFKENTRHHFIRPVYISLGISNWKDILQTTILLLQLTKTIVISYFHPLPKS